MADKAVRVLISGRVQGVYFRAYTRDMARPLGLKGYVRNLPDGRVEAVFQGPEDKIDQAVAWCHQGSPNARVDAVEVETITPQEVYADFQIRY